MKKFETQVEEGCNRMELVIRKVTEEAILRKISGVEDFFLMKNVRKKFDRNMDFVWNSWKLKQEKIEINARIRE